MLLPIVFITEKTFHSHNDIILTGTKPISGYDSTGSYTGVLYQYKAGTNSMNAEIAVYNEGEFVRFTQVWLFQLIFSKYLFWIGYDINNTLQLLATTDGLFHKKRLE